MLLKGPVGGGLSGKYIGSIENDRQNQTLLVCYKIVTALKVDLPEIFKFDEGVTAHVKMEI